jgi:hypothetical protein
LELELLELEPPLGLAGASPGNGNCLDAGTDGESGVSEASGAAGTPPRVGVPELGAGGSLLSGSPGNGNCWVEPDLLAGAGVALQG